MNRRCPFRAAIAADLANGAAWARSYQDCKEIVAAMIADGEVERVAPEGASYRNMIALSGVGAERYFGKGASVHFVPSRADQCDAIAEIVADGGSLASAARAIGVCYRTAQKRWREICHGLGEQAS